MARVAGPVGVCLSVQGHGASWVPPQRGNSPGPLWGSKQRNELPAPLSPSQKHSLQIFLGSLMLLQLFKNLLRQGRKTRAGLEDIHRMRDSFNGILTYRSVRRCPFIKSKTLP